MELTTDRVTRDANRLKNYCALVEDMKKLSLHEKLQREKIFALEQSLPKAERRVIEARWLAVTLAGVVIGILLAHLV